MFRALHADSKRLAYDSVAPTPVNVDLFDAWAWARLTCDPDSHVIDWFRGEAPASLSRQIPVYDVFPADTPSNALELPELTDPDLFCNYNGIDEGDSPW